MSILPRCSLACQSCRAKKKKCDSLGSSDPCTNCRLSGFECFVVQGSKKRQRRHYPDSSAALKVPRPEKHNADRAYPANQIKVAALPNSVCPDQETGKSGLPSFIALINKDIPDEDLNYLKAVGAFRLPDANLCRLMIQAFIQFVYPYLPCVDLQQFLCSIQSHGTSGKISLLLFQAVMFVAVAFIDDRVMQVHGFRNVREARKVFFRRVKALHDLDVESDRITMLQASLLMSYFYDHPNEPKDVEYWLGIAITLARGGGLDKAETYSGLPLDQQRYMKRIWWSCYSRDRTFCIGFHRSPLIKDGEFDVPYLQVHDMEDYDIVRRLSWLCGIQIPYLSTNKKRLPADMFIQYLVLCKLIGRTLRIRVGLDNSEDFRAHRYGLIDFSQHVRCDDDLKEWHNSLPVDLHFSATNRGAFPTTSFQLLTLHRAFLKSIYLTTVAILHCPLFRACHYDRFCLPQELKTTIRERVHESAIELSTMFRDIDARGFVKLVPLSAIAGLYAAMQCHALEIEARHNYAPETLLRNVHCGSQVLRVVGDLYASAAFVSSAIDSAITTALQSTGAISPRDLHFPAHGNVIEAVSLRNGASSGLELSRSTDVFLHTTAVLSWFNLTAEETSLLSELVSNASFETSMERSVMPLPATVAGLDETLSLAEDMFLPAAERSDQIYLDYINDKDHFPYDATLDGKRKTSVGKLRPKEAFFWRLIDSSLSPLLPIAKAERL